MKRLLVPLGLIVVLAAPALAQAEPEVFPISVWLQDPSDADEYQAIGVNLYIGLWQGPTQSQLQTLQAADMPVITSMNNYAEQLLAANDPLLDTVVGWSQQDEPDNAQPDGMGGFGPPVDPDDIVARYNEVKALDPTRPVWLNLGQGVAWDGWVGRGVRTNHPEDYPQYLQGTDIASFDIYPASSTRAEIQGDLWRVGYGVERMVGWAEPDQTVWNVIETSNIHGVGQATPDEVRAMVWMSIINGSRGITYFVHAWDADGDLVSTRQLLEDDEMRDAVTDINAQVQELAPVIFSDNVITQNVSADSTHPDTPIDLMATQHEGSIYLFAVPMEAFATTATFTIDGLTGDWTAHVLGENRQISVVDGVFQDAFSPWQTHLYRLDSVPEPGALAMLAATALLIWPRRRTQATRG